MLNRREMMRLSGGSLLAAAMPAVSQSALLPDEKKLGVALVGLGYYSEFKLAPALLESKHCRLTGIVTGTPSKIPIWKEKYNLPDSAVFSYETFDQIAENDDIDIVYNVLPNSMHAEYSIRAAQAGKHVICEKPMANTVRECDQIIEACEKAGVRLQIGYRLMYEPNTKEIYRLANEQVHGAVNYIESSNAFYAGDNASNWRFTSPALSGGGPLMDMGVYSIHAIRQVMQEEPIAVTAQAYRSRPFMFKGMEETLLYQLYFRNEMVINCMTSYSARISRMYINAEKGHFTISPAFGYGPLKININGDDATLPHTNHQADQFDAFALNISDGTEVVASGLQGLLDMKVIEAVYKAMYTGSKVLV